MSQCVRLKEWYCRAQQQNFWHRFLKNFLRPNEFYSIKRLSDNHYVLKVDSHSSGRRGEGAGGGGGTVYTSAATDSGTGYKNHCFPLEEGIFYFRLTLENRAVLLSSNPCYSPWSSNALQSKNLMQADYKQMRDNKNVYYYFLLIVRNRVGKSFLFCLEQV